MHNAKHGPFRVSEMGGYYSLGIHNNYGALSKDASSSETVELGALFLVELS